MLCTMPTLKFLILKSTGHVLLKARPISFNPCYLLAFVKERKLTFIQHILSTSFYAGPLHMLLHLNFLKDFGSSDSAQVLPITAKSQDHSTGSQKIRVPDV